MKSTAHRLPRPFGLRAYVGGVLYIEGVICLLVGCTMLFSYWPPFATEEEPRNPISMVGLVICAISLTYMITVGLGLFIYNLLRPAPEEHLAPVQVRAQRYAASNERHADYVWDETLECEADAEEAFIARQMY